MNRDHVNAGLAAIVMTLAETGEAREGTIYAAMMDRYSLDEFGMMIGLLKVAGMIETGLLHRVRITEKGRELANKINLFVKEERDAHR